MFSSLDELRDAPVIECLKFFEKAVFTGYFSLDVKSKHPEEYCGSISRIKYQGKSASFIPYYINVRKERRIKAPGFYQIRFCIDVEKLKADSMYFLTIRSMSILHIDTDNRKNRDAMFSDEKRRSYKQKAVKDERLFNLGPNNSKITALEKGQQSSRPKYSANYTEDFSNPSITGTILKIVAFRNNKLAFTDTFNGFDGGILFPQNVMLKHEPLPYEKACQLIHIIYESGQKVGFESIGITNFNDKCYAILSLNYDNLLPAKDVEFFEKLKVGDIYPIEVISSTPNLKKVKVPTTGLYGYISTDNYRKLSSEDNNLVTVPVASVPNNEGAPIIFGAALPHHIRIDRKYEENLRIRYNNLFNSLELQCMSSQDSNLIDVMLSEYPSFGLDAKHLQEIEEQNILCRYDDPSTDAQKVRNDLQNLLDDNNFWAAPRQLNGKNYLTLYNHRSVVFEIEERNNTFYLVGLYDATKDVEGQKKLDAAQHSKLKIRGVRVRIFSMYDTIPSDYSASMTYLYISRLDSYFKLKYKLGKKVNSSIESTAKDFKNQLLYLEYQSDKEYDKIKNQINFVPQKLRPVSGEWQDEGVSIKIDMLASEYLQLLGYDTDEDTATNEIRVNTIDTDRKVKDHCELKINVEGEYILRFIGNHKNIKDYLEEGITLQGDANVKHLKMQTYAIKDFTHEDTLFRDLVGDNISIPDWHQYDNIKFLNDELNHVEPGNNQPEAVKKALVLGERGVLLIQGPPGTGKTTTIVEIIRQLILEKKKILVCSQSHAAVKNIYDKLVPYCENILRIDKEDHSISNSRNFNSEDYEKFLENNIVLLSRLRGLKEDQKISKDILKGFEYSNEVINEQYIRLHMLLAQYYKDNKELDDLSLQATLDYLKSEAKNISGSMLDTQIYQSKDAILGTCIGVGMNYILKNNTVHFDTVIIDEAAKANLAETIVPMGMGDRYVLVGDDNQLPPYVDQGEIKEMLSQECYNSDKKLSLVEMISSQNKSLFEYLHYHRDPLFPEECLVTLNYQYRMNPQIGDFISNLFYGGKIFNGAGTDKQNIFVPGYPNPVTIIDTSGQKDNNETTVKGTTSHRNECEARYICDEIIPKLSTVIMNNEKISVGIISPYSSQCDYIRSLIGDNKLRNAVHTIDSIQGMEFDIVVFSFVRSFKYGSKAKVGFVDDMKRLNVSLSRAKKKLIVIGDMNTLTNPSAHYDVETDGVKPIDVFKKLSALPTKISITKTSIEHFLSSGIEINEILPQCSWGYRYRDNIQISFEYKGRNYHFPMRVTSSFTIDKKTSEKIDLKYIGQGKDSKPFFNFISEEDNIKYTYYNIMCKCISIKEFPLVTFEVEGKQVKINMANKKSLKLGLQEGMMFYVKRDNPAYADIDIDKQYEYFKETHPVGSYVEGVVVGHRELDRMNPPLTLYSVTIGGFSCGCVSSDDIDEGTCHKFLYSKFDDDMKRITLKYYFQYDI